MPEIDFFLKIITVTSAISKRGSARKSTICGAIFIQIIELLSKYMLA